MFNLKPNYVTDNGNKKVAVQLNIKTYEKIEEILENYGLFHLMEDEPAGDPLSLNEAKAHYKRLKKEK
jgi:RelB antitoxin of RelBE toxin-antitoxin system